MLCKIFPVSYGAIMRSILAVFFGLILGASVPYSHAYAGGNWTSGKLTNVRKSDGVLYISIMRLDGQYYDFLSQTTDVGNCKIFNPTLMPREEDRNLFGITYRTQVIDTEREHIETLETLQNAGNEIQISFITESGRLIQTGACDFETAVSTHTFDNFSSDNPHITVGF